MTRVRANIGSVIVLLGSLGCARAGTTPSSEAGAVPSSTTDGASTPSPSAGGTARAAPSMTEAEAKVIAERVARDARIDLDRYRIVRVELADEWSVFFEHVPPAPPGHHFIVVIHPSTRAVRFVRGE